MTEKYGWKVESSNKVNTPEQLSYFDEEKFQWWYDDIQRELAESHGDGVNKAEIYKEALFSEDKTIFDNKEKFNEKEEVINEKDKVIIDSYVSTFCKIFEHDEKLNKIVDALKNWEKYQLNIIDIEWIYRALDAWRERKNEWKFSFDPKAIEHFHTFNCSWWSFLMASIINRLWWNAKIVRVYHHILCVVKIWDNEYLVDTINKKIENITGKFKVENTDIDSIKKYETEESNFFGLYSIWYVYDSISQAEKEIHAGNYADLQKKLK